MKGPGARYDIDVRRLWECPSCGNRVKHLGHITARRCNCEAEQWMRLIDEKRVREFPVREKIVIPEDDPPEPVEDPTPEPAISEAATETPTEQTSSDGEDSETSEQSRNKKKKRKKKKRPAENKSSSPQQAESSDSSPRKTEKNASENGDDPFGENIFDDQ